MSSVALLHIIFPNGAVLPVVVGEVVAVVVTVLDRVEDTNDTESTFQALAFIENESGEMMSTPTVITPVSPDSFSAASRK